MSNSLAITDSKKAPGEQIYVETLDAPVVGVRDDLIIADGEKDVRSHSFLFPLLYWPALLTDTCLIDQWLCLVSLCRRWYFWFSL